VTDVVMLAILVVAFVALFGLIALCDAVRR
jgi:hypothetical protein